MSGPVAHLNIGQLRHGWDDPRSAGFVQATGRVNALAEAAPGFVWRLNDDTMQAAQLGPPLNDPSMASTLSVWQSAAALRRFAYEGVHGRFYRRRAQWFETLEGPTHVVWPVAAGHRPDMAEALSMLERLRQEGPSTDCFDLGWEGAP